MIWPAERERREITTLVSGQIIDHVLVSLPLLDQLQLGIPALTVEEVRGGEMHQCVALKSNGTICL